MKEDLLKAMSCWMKDSTQNKFPSSQIPTVYRVQSEFSNPPETGYRVTWISHSQY